MDLPLYGLVGWFLAACLGVKSVMKRVVTRREMLGSRFYHGTPADLSVGDIVEPRTKRSDGNSYAWATTNVSAALEWGNNQHVYVVEPLGPYEHWNGSIYRSLNGWRIIGEI